MTFRSACVGALCAFLTISSATAADQTPFQITVIDNLTGPAAFVGASSRNAIIAAGAVANRDGGILGHPVQFEFSDDQSNPQVALQLANGLIAKKVPLFLGPGFTATCRAVTSMVASGPLTYCLSPGIDTVKDSYQFASGPSFHEFALIIYRYARLRGFKRWSVIYTTDATGQAAEATTNDVLRLPEFKDVAIVASEHFNPGDLEVSAQLSRIKAANPQMIVAWPSGTPFGTVLHGINQVGLNVPVLATAANLNADQLKQYGAFVPAELIFEGAPSTISYAANAVMKRRQEVLLDVLTAAGVHDRTTAPIFDLTSIVIDAYRKNGLNATAEQLRASISSITNYTGAAGIYDFTRYPGRGVGVDSLIMLRYDPAKNDFYPVSRLGGQPSR
jgi:branched-chain amino acid transport system substrate-binding protein